MPDASLTGPAAVPPFVPPPWLRNPHAQTILAAFWPSGLPPHTARLRHVTLPDGDVLAVHDDLPAAWNGRAAILAHGLAATHRSPLLVRLAAKLAARGVRVFRWEMRGCGSGAGLARMPYHGGCSADLAAVVAAVVDWCRADAPAAPPDVALFGVSLGGNVVLKYLGEDPAAVPAEVGRAIAVNPPVDLLASVATLEGPITRFYDRHFLAAVERQVADRRRLRPDAPEPRRPRPPRTLFEFDHTFTAPLLGHASAADYYRAASSAPHVPAIRVPTTIVTSRDDPLVPIGMFAPENLPRPPAVRLMVTDHGGHCGYLGRTGRDPDPHWLEWRVVELICG
jgi:predicted alpha/beta-fold hydrolase